MPDPLRKLPINVEAQNPSRVKEAFNGIGSLVEPTAEVKFDVSAEAAFAANTRRFTITVTDLLPTGQRWEGRWLVLVYVAATENGDPSAAGNTVAFSAGTVLQTITANAAYLMLTNTIGQIQLDLTIAGAATRHVYAEVLGKPLGSGAKTWA